MGESKPDPLLSSEDVKLDKRGTLDELRLELEDLLDRYGERNSLTIGSASDGTVMIQALIRPAKSGKERAELVQRRKQPPPPAEKTPFRRKG